MSCYTIKSLQKAFTLLEDELQGAGRVAHGKNHIEDMYLQFQMLAERVSDKQALDKSQDQLPEF